MIALCLFQMLTLGVGFGVLLTSLLLTYIVSSKADILFSSEREPSNATYWLTKGSGPHLQLLLLLLFQPHTEKLFLIKTQDGTLH